MIKSSLIFILTFILLYFYLSDGIDEYCYDFIEEKDNKVYIYNTKAPLVPGINPIEFDNLEKYKKSMRWKGKNGSDCPVLYFKRKYTTQNKLGYQLAEDPSSNSTYTFPPDPPTNRKHNGMINYDRNLFKSELVENTSHYPGFDPNDQDIGKKNPIDMTF